jgi:ribonuclease-3
MTPSEHVDRACEVLGLSMRDPALLETALTHPSWASEHDAAPDYQRLEFLGDAVLALIVSERLYLAFPDLPEGDLTRMRISVVRGGALARAARGLGLGPLIRLGRGSSRGRDQDRTSVLEAAMESVIGAVYLDGGIEAARSFVDHALAEMLDARALAAQVSDAKSRLQELTQARGLGLPEYRETGHDGPDHERTFSVEVVLGERVVGAGSGPSKQAAAQAAAAAALVSLSIA